LLLTAILGQRKGVLCGTGSPQGRFQKDRWFFTNGWGIAEQQKTTGDESVQAKPKGADKK
jgi:hypothetical protein